MFSICCLQVIGNQILRTDPKMQPFAERCQAQRIADRMNAAADPGMEYHVYCVR